MRSSVVVISYQTGNLVPGAKAAGSQNALTLGMHGIQRQLTRGLVMLLALTFAAALPGEIRPAAPGFGFPVPPRSEQLLFYLQRSMNANTVVYEANMKPNGELDPSNPVRVYWLRYNTTGEAKALSFVERHLAFGVRATPIADEVGGYDVGIVSYRERSARVYVDGHGRPIAVTRIHGRKARLDWVFLMLGDYEFIPRVEFIELFGTDIETGEPVYERFEP